MPYNFVLPTTSSISFADSFTSGTHPSLTLGATTCRGVVRDALKNHKRLPPQSQASNLSNVLNVLNEYIPYLFALDAGLSGKPVAGEEVEVDLQRELEVEWRPTLTASIPGREPPRVKLRSLEAEISFTLSTLAYTYSLLARTQLHTLHNATSLTPEQRAAAIASAMRHLLDANSIHTFLAARSTQWSAPVPALDISQPVLSALAALTLAEATLITVLKDDPYPAAVAEDRNPNSRDWMFKNPDIPKVRAHLFARLCLAAAEHAARAQAMLARARGVDERLPRYLDDLRRTAKGKACRFFGVDAELAGKTGEGIAWLRAAKREMGFVGVGSDEESKLKGFTRLKKEWAEKREDKRIEKGVDWGSDAGKFEEGRIVGMLEKKWVKVNDTMNVQTIPPFEPLLATMPSGREYHSVKPYQPPTLDENVIARMRAPPDPGDAAFQGDEEDSGAEESVRSEPVGAFPGTRADYAGSSSTYY